MTIIIYSLFYLLINFLIYKILGNTKNLKFQFLVVFTFYLLLLILGKIHGLIYHKSFMIKPDLFIILLSLSFGGIIINIFHTYGSAKLHTFKKIQSSYPILNKIYNLNYLAILLALITFTQIFILIAPNE